MNKKKRGRIIKGKRRKIRFFLVVYVRKKRDSRDSTSISLFQLGPQFSVKQLRYTHPQINLLTITVVRRSNILCTDFLCISSPTLPFSQSTLTIYNEVDLCFGMRKEGSEYFTRKEKDQRMPIEKEKLGKHYSFKHAASKH